MGANRVWSPVCEQGSGGCKNDLFKNRSGPQVGVGTGYWRVSEPPEQPHLGCEKVQGQQLAASPSCHRFGVFWGESRGECRGLFKSSSTGQGTQCNVIRASVVAPVVEDLLKGQKSS